MPSAVTPRPTSTALYYLFKRKGRPIAGARVRNESGASQERTSPDFPLIAQCACKDDCHVTLEMAAGNVDDILSFSVYKWSSYSGDYLPRLGPAVITAPHALRSDYALLTTMCNGVVCEFPPVLCIATFSRTDPPTPSRVGRPIPANRLRYCRDVVEMVRRGVVEMLI